MPEHPDPITHGRADRTLLGPVARSPAGPPARRLPRWFARQAHRMWTLRTWGDRRLQRCPRRRLAPREAAADRPA